MQNDLATAHARTFDPNRGAFDVTERPPVVDREKNPKGTRHIDKTRQDHMPRDQRPRVQEADRRLQLRRKGV